MNRLNQPLMALFLAAVCGCGQQLVDFPGPAVPPVPPGPTVPTVTATDPANGATLVVATRAVTATFSEAMATSTLSTATFTLRQTAAPGTAVTGTVSSSANSATFVPQSALQTNQQYTATITTGAKSAASGTALAADYSWSFTTSALPPGPPTLTAVMPAPLATLVPLNATSTATFSQPMDGATLVSPATAFTVKVTATGVAVPGAVTYSGNTATFTPTGSLLQNTNYTSSVSSAAKDLAGTALASGTLPNSWTWTTAPVINPNPTLPKITQTSPLDQATGVPTNATISATFNEGMDNTTLTTQTFTVQDTSPTSIPGSVSYDVQRKVATFTPLAPLASGMKYTAKISNGAKDLAGNALVSPSQAADPVPNPWSFTTAAAPVPLALNLGAAATFGLASRAGLTSTGVAVINGDVALYPNFTCTDATGGPGLSAQTCMVRVYQSSTGLTVNGFIYWAGDPFDNGVTANRVTNDLNSAWVAGTNKADTHLAIPADQMAGVTFTPGVYHNANLGLAALGTATMDAQGDPNATFFFKVDSDFVDSGTTLQPSKIVLSNGAQARNVWFIVGRDLTIGAGTDWSGNILAGRTVTVNHSSTVLGRVLAGAGGAGALTITGAAAPSLTTITVPQ